MTKRGRLWFLIGAIGAVAAVLIVGLLSIPIRSETLKERVIALLSDQLESEVTVERLEGRVFPRVSVSGGGVVIRQKGRTDVPPLISIREFEIHGSLRDLMRHPRRVAEVRLQGLEVKIPPGDGNDENDQTPAEQRERAGRLEQVIIDRFEAPDTVVMLIPRKAGKQAKIFTIHHLVMDRLGINQTIPYIATLTNPVPKGEIETSGTFGPWDVASPARTPVTGTYVFDKANLDTIDGLAGILSSTGTFGGPLNRIEVQGTTETPDFQIDVGGAPVPLTTRFTALVDGSDGDTYLKQVDAKILNSELTASGAVIGFEGVRGRQVEIDVDMPNGRIEDLLRLAMNSEKPILNGAVHFKAKMVIPPERKKVIDKLKVQGEFRLTKATFTDASVQSKLMGLSRRGQGKGKNDPSVDVVSNLSGRMVVDNATVSFSRLRFSVPGARVELAGRYGMRSETLRFRGHLRLQATLSQVAGGGVKGFFLKALDPFFRKPGAGMVLPIKITGNRKAPKFGLDMF
ncbi:MAG TPA: AsmA-like C-terminal region-containing protein [Vicinamibacterales bacterium]|nr:AsmA-like C-terminal region-containing protein [Vicinamibacterales bacterium]